MTNVVPLPFIVWMLDCIQLQVGLGNLALGGATIDLIYDHRDHCPVPIAGRNQGLVKKSINKAGKHCIVSWQYQDCARETTNSENLGQL